MFSEVAVGVCREDGSAEVELSETRVLGYVTAQLVQPYKERPNEGTLAIFAEFSPMADPAYEPGRPGEAAIELGRVIDRGLRSPNLLSDLLWSNIIVEFNDDFCCFSGRAEPWIWSHCALLLGSMSGQCVSIFTFWTMGGMYELYILPTDIFIE
jgi:hypothetical protein